MDESVYDKYRRAGKITAAARDYGTKLIREGVSYLEVATKVESKILESGAGLAFPVNISINEVAAHFTPKHSDDVLVFKKGDVVKLDVGAHIDGYIGDTAVTVEVGTNKYSDMIKASRHALDNAVALMSSKVKLSDVGKTIQETINSYGYKPIDNLTGHSLEKYTLHSGLSIPNVQNRLDVMKLKIGDVVAIEPFATDGAGHVISGKSSNIYRYTGSARTKIIRDIRTRVLAMKIHKNFNTLPFAERWCKKISQNVDIELRKLLMTGCIKEYPQLIDAKRGIVTQAEHTVIIHEDECEVTT
ncbi:MAG: type II methionyl aminopeptidase [Candidatus Thermoplasmatota archaeon]|jgi:methionyl aminopeptidase|nr:type II methionyl aminopeptidase [Candidatus Thermoplasmatota archaeon]